MKEGIKEVIKKGRKEEGKGRKEGNGMKKRRKEGRVGGR